MRGFIVGTVVTAIAFFVLTQLLPKYTSFDMISYDGEPLGLAVLAIIFGVVNGLIGPIVRTLALPISMMTMGLVGFLDQRRPAAAHGDHRQDGRVRPDDRRLPAGPVHRPHPRRRRRRRGRAEPRQHRRAACRPRLTGRGAAGSPRDAGHRRPLREAAARYGTPAYVTDLATLDGGRRGRPRRIPGPVDPPVLGQGQRRPGDRRGGRPRAASGRTSCRAANGRSPGAPASRTTGSRSRASARPMRTCARPSARRGRRHSARVGRARIGRRGRGRHPDGAPSGSGPARPAGRSTSSSGSTRTSRPRPSPGSRSATGTSKFGMTETEATALVEWLAAHAGGAVRPRGIHLHVGSQLRAVDAWRDAVRRGLAVVGLLRGGLPAFDTLDVGGGFPVLPLDEPAPATRAVRARDPRPARGRPRGPAPAPSRDRARPRPGRAVGLARGERPPRPRSRRAAGRHRRRDDRADPAGPVRRPAPDRGADLARPGHRGAATATRPGRDRADPRRGPDLRIDRRARRSTTCRRSAAATSSRSATRARMAPRWRRPTTDGRTRRRSWSRRTGGSGSRAARGPDGSRQDDVRASRARAARPRSPPSPGCWSSPAVRPRPRRRTTAPPPGPPFPEPGRRPGRLRLRRHLSPRARSPTPRRRSTPSRRGPAPRSSSTPRTVASTRRPTRPRRRRAQLMDQWGVGRNGFNDGLVIFFDMQPNLQHGQVQLYAGPGFEAAYLSNEERQAIFENDMLPYLRVGRLRRGAGGRAREGRRGRDAGARGGAPALASDQRGRRPGRRSDHLPRPVGLGALPLAPVRQGPGLSRRPVGADAGATARPDRRVRRDDHGRVHLAPSVDDGDARPRVTRPHRVPRGRRRRPGTRRSQGRDRCRPGQGRRRGRGAAPAQRPPPDRPGRAARAHAARDARRRRGRRVHHARRPAEVRLGGERLRHRARDPRRRSRLVRREAEQGRRALDRSRRRSPSWPASSRSSPGSTSRSRA